MARQDRATLHKLYLPASAASVQGIPLNFSGGGGSGAVGYATVANGAISGLVLVSGGSGYTSAPTVSVGGYTVLLIAQAASNVNYALYGDYSSAVDASIILPSANSMQAVVHAPQLSAAIGGGAADSTRGSRWSMFGMSMTPARLQAIEQYSGYAQNIVAAAYTGSNIIGTVNPRIGTVPSSTSYTGSGNIAAAAVFIGELTPAQLTQTYTDFQNWLNRFGTGL